jgi:hypothetical protein
MHEFSYFNIIYFSQRCSLFNRKGRKGLLKPQRTQSQDIDFFFASFAVKNVASSRRCESRFLFDWIKVTKTGRKYHPILAVFIL